MSSPPDISLAASSHVAPSSMLIDISLESCPTIHVPLPSPIIVAALPWGKALAKYVKFAPESWLFERSLEFTAIIVEWAAEPVDTAQYCKVRIF